MVAAKAGARTDGSEGRGKQQDDEEGFENLGDEFDEELSGFERFRARRRVGANACGRGCELLRVVVPSILWGPSQGRYTGRRSIPEKRSARRERAVRLEFGPTPSDPSGRTTCAIEDQMYIAIPAQRPASRSRFILPDILSEVTFDLIPLRLHFIAPREIHFPDRHGGESAARNARRVVHENGAGCCVRPPIHPGIRRGAERIA